MAGGAGAEAEKLLAPRPMSASLNPKCLRIEHGGAVASTELAQFF
jgi:hypothetical protein